MGFGGFWVWRVLGLEGFGFGGSGRGTGVPGYQDC
jgi:hypothetical protein